MEPLIEHFQHVYNCLAISTVFSFIGVASIGLCFQSMTRLAIFSGVGSAITFLLLLLTTDIPDKNRVTRMGYLLSFAGFTGIGMTTLYRDVFKQEPTVIATALLEAILIFSCLSGCALFSMRGRYLCLGIPLTILLFILIIFSSVNVIENTYWMSKTIVYLTLFTMCGLVLYDTQTIMERFRKGDEDFIQQTVNVFTDFIGIYRRLMILGMDKKIRAESADEDQNSDTWFGFLTTNTMAPIYALS